MNGELEFFKEDEKFGKGFCGNLSLTLLDNVTIEASTTFGHNGNFRYWYADALFESQQGVPIMSGIHLYGLGGGLYQNMKQVAPNQSNNGAKCRTASGLLYEPDKGVKLGFKATSVIGLPQKETFNADLTFEMVFSNSGGLSYVGFEGVGRFLTSNNFNADEIKSRATKLPEGKKNA